MSAPRLIRIKHVCAIIGLSRSSVYNLMQEDDFPQSIKIGKRAIAFSEQAVNDWVAAKIRSAI